MGLKAILVGLSLVLFGHGAIAAENSAAAEGAASPPEEVSLPLDFGGPFHLIDHRGKRRTEQSFRGKYLLVYFGYTSCPDICPAGLQEIAATLALLDDWADKVRALFVTVDPARDTPAELRAYIDLFDDRIVGLTGTEAEIAAVSKAYRVHRAKVAVASAEGGDDYLVTHSPNTFLMGPDGDFLALFPHGTEAAQMAETIAKYIAEGGGS